MCYWARLSSLDTSDIIDNHNSAGPQVIEILPSDKAFLTQNCGTWTLASAATASAQPSPLPQSSSIRLPDADGQGFYDGPRCRDHAAFILRTPESKVAICALGGTLYSYNGLRISDGGRIELQGAAPMGTGFTATNPTEGIRYEVSRDGLKIYTNGQVHTETAIEFAP